MPAPDSLRRQLAGAVPDTTRVLLLSELCHQLERSDVTQALRYGRQGLQLARRIGFERGEVDCLAVLASTVLLQHDYVAASQYYQQVLRRAGQQPWAAKSIMLAWLGLGRIAAQEDEFSKADKYFRLALASMRRYPAPLADVIMGQNHLAMLYAGWLRSGKPAPDSLPRLHDRYARLALASYRRQGSRQELATALNGMGLVHQLAQRYDSAAYCHQAALRIHQRFGNRYGAAQTRLSLAEIYGTQQRWALALPLLQVGIAEAHALGAIGVEALGYKLLAENMAATGQGMEAYRMARIEQRLLDSVQSADRREALARLQVQFDTERQRNHVRTLSQQARLQTLEAHKQRHYLLLTIAVLVVTAAGLLGSGVLAWRLRRSRAQLAHQNEELTTTRAEQDRLYALVAHDLRSPVVAFGGLADLMTRYIERQDTARLAGLGGRVRQASENLRALLDNLLSWALSQRGELVPTLDAVPVPTLLTEIAELYQPSAEAAGVTLVVDNQAIGSAHADRNMTYTILRNLVSNALQATPAGGTITLSATAISSNTLEVRVTDTGAGIGPERLAQLLSGEITPRAAGVNASTGLGLRLSVVFARVQAGSLQLQSAPDQGTTAILQLPAVVVAATAHSPQPDTSIPATGAPILTTGANYAALT